MANGKDAKRLKRNAENPEKSEVLRIRLQKDEWAVVSAMVQGGIAGCRTRPCRAAAIEALVMAGLYCIQHHPDRYHEAAPLEAKGRLKRALRRLQKRGPKP